MNTITAQKTKLAITSVRLFKANSICKPSFNTPQMKILARSGSLECQLHFKIYD